jgi:hypothetical protein
MVAAGTRRADLRAAGWVVVPWDVPPIKTTLELSGEAIAHLKALDVARDEESSCAGNGPSGRGRDEHWAEH